MMEGRKEEERTGGLGDGRIEVEDIPGFFVECQFVGDTVTTGAPGASKSTSSALLSFTSSQVQGEEMTVGRQVKGERYYKKKRRTYNIWQEIVAMMSHWPRGVLAWRHRSSSPQMLQELRGRCHQPCYCPRVFGGEWEDARKEERLQE